MKIPDQPGTAKSPKSHIEILDFLRGLAALSVVFFHFANSNLPTIRPNPLAEFFSKGMLGVQVFFVISGFIIPYSMYKSGYTINRAFSFLAKRFVRIGPPSWVAILLVAVIYYGSIWLNGRPIEDMHWPGTSLKTILANLTYTYSFFDAGKYIDVYWTLEVEFQYYFLIAFLLPLLLNVANKPVLLSLVLIVISLSYFAFNNEILFFRDNSYFLLGILLFLYKIGKIERNYFVYATMVMMLICFGQQDLAGSFAAIIAFLVIAFVQFKNPVTTFLGQISYSLYITHFFSGAIAEFILKKITGESMGDPMKAIMLFVYTGIAIGFAWVFYITVEKPFIKLSKKVWSPAK